VAAARQRLDGIEEKTNEISKKKPWITKELKKDVYDKLTEVRNWISEKIEKQAESPLNVDPIFKIADIEVKVKRVETLFTKMSSKSKPKEPSSSSSSSGNSKYGKNIKIDNITIDGNSGDMNWDDLIKINNGNN